MKKNTTKVKILFSIVFILLLLGLLVSENLAFSKEKAHKQVTQDLIDLVKNNPEIKQMLVASITKAKKVNPDLKTNPVQSLSDYYDYIDNAVELIPQNILKNPANLTRDQILQSICYFYFLIDQPLPELKGKGLFNHSLQYYPPFSAWVHRFVNAWGDFLNTEKSWDQKTYQGYYNDPRFGLQKGWYESSSHWKTFNAFFSRYLKSIDARPIASPEDPTIVVAPADSVPQGAWAIDKDSNINVAGGLKIKLTTFYNVNDLLSSDSQYKNAFANGVFTHMFLNVNDYHRYHFAVGGTIKEKKNIAQNVALEVLWDQQQNKYVPIVSTGWQFTQTRGYVIVDTGKYGLVALIPMGMAQVSSVNFEENIKPGITHKKGSMLGNFLFGGSDFVMLFQNKAGFEINAPKVKQTTTKTDQKLADIYQHILMGEKYGVMHGMP
ncbi:MAG: phosphatidylserine decarboxylase [Methylococcaceae bacterium]|nr:phosphatidylserine decarboxylase [Methylococcaceae bacterium]